MGAQQTPPRRQQQQRQRMEQLPAKSREHSSFTVLPSKKKNKGSEINASEILHLNKTTLSKDGERAGQAENEEGKKVHKPCTSSQVLAGVARDASGEGIGRCMARSRTRLCPPYRQLASHPVGGVGHCTPTSTWRDA